MKNKEVAAKSRKGCNHNAATTLAAPVFRHIRCNEVVLTTSDGDCFRAANHGFWTGPFGCYFPPQTMLSESVRNTYKSIQFVYIYLKEL